jgi:hypothetical protein
MITLDYLKSLDACSPAVDWFSAEFPEGAETKDALAACHRDDWVCWFACRVSENYRWWCAGKAFEWAAQRHLTLRQWANNVNADNWRSAAASAYAAYTASAAYDAAVAAARIKTKAEVLAIVRRHYPTMPERNAS